MIVQLIGKKENYLYHLSLMSERASVARLPNQTRIFHPVVEELYDDFFWVDVRDGQIAPDRIAIELSSRTHRSCELWLSLPKTIDEFLRSGIHSVSQQGINLRHVTIERTS